MSVVDFGQDFVGDRVEHKIGAGRNGGELFDALVSGAQALDGFDPAGIFVDETGEDVKTGNGHIRPPFHKRIRADIAPGAFAVSTSNFYCAKSGLRQGWMRRPEGRDL